jgi:hypothetical protein
MSGLKNEMDEYSIDYFIEIISAFINGTNPHAKKALSWDDILYLSQIHAVAGIMGYTAQKETSSFRPNAEAAKIHRGLYLHTIQSSVRSAFAYQRIIDEFTKNQIPHIVMKGHVVKDYYPVMELRSMGDLDLVAHEEDLDKIDKIMIESGFVLKDTIGFVREYASQSVQVEIHSKLFSSTYKEKNDRMIRYFEDCWRHASAGTNGYTYYLDHAYHLLYLLGHMAKHFLAGGCGIRMLMDIAVYLNHFSGKLDFHFIYKELQTLEMTRFADTIFELCNIWFQTHAPGNEIESWLRSALKDLIIKKGVFGNIENNPIAGQLRKDYEINPNKNRKLQGIASLFAMIFPGRSVLCAYDPKANKGFFHAFTAWFIRAYFLLVQKKGYSKTIYRNIRTAALMADHSYKLLREIGL